MMSTVTAWPPAKRCGGAIARCSRQQQQAASEELSASISTRRPANACSANRTCACLCNTCNAIQLKSPAQLRIVAGWLRQRVSAHMCRISFRKLLNVVPLKSDRQRNYQCLQRDRDCALFTALSVGVVRDARSGNNIHTLTRSHLGIYDFICSTPLHNSWPDSENRRHPSL